MQSLRQRQIDEIVNQDLNINKQVVVALNKQVAAFNESTPAPTTDQAINTDKLLNLIDGFNQYMIAAIEDLDTKFSIAGATEAGIDLEKFNTIMRLRTFIIKNNYNAKNLINQQMQTLIPPINSYIVAYNSAIEKFINNETQNEKNAVRLAKFYSVLAMVEAARTSLVTGSYRPIDLNDVDATFNKNIRQLQPNIKNAVLFGLAKSPLSGFNRGNGEGYKEAKKRLEIELGRTLTPNDDLLVAIRLGNFTQYKPILTNTQISMFDAKPMIDISDIPSVPQSGSPSIFVPPPPQTALQNEASVNTPVTSAQVVLPNEDMFVNYRDDQNDLSGLGKINKSVLRRFM